MTSGIFQVNAGTFSQGHKNNMSCYFLYSYISGKMIDH